MISIPGHEPRLLIRLAPNDNRILPPPGVHDQPLQNLIALAPKSKVAQVIHFGIQHRNSFKTLRCCEQVRHGIPAIPLYLCTRGSRFGWCRFWTDRHNVETCCFELTAVRKSFWFSWEFKYG